MAPLPLHHPARCTDDLPADLTKPYLAAELKLDGSRYDMYLGAGTDPYGRQKAPNTLLSRRPSKIDGKLVDKTANLPHITDKVYAGLDGTILDGEIFLTGQDFTSTSSIMLSSPQLARQKQESGGWLDYYVFDVVMFRGIDVSGKPLYERRKILEEIVKRMGNPNVRLMPHWRACEVVGSGFMTDFKAVGGDDEWILKKFTEVVEKGGEGLIIKDLRQGYGRGWAKMKKSYDVSCVVIGWKPGTGKYIGQIGSLTLGVYVDGKMVEVGYASGFDDTLRKEMSANFKAFEGRVVDVFAHELSKDKADGGGKRLRHATWHRFRDDVNANECTMEKLVEDMSKKTKAKFQRSKE